MGALHALGLHLGALVMAAGATSAPVEFLEFVLKGIPQGCVYALVGVGLTLTYKTSGTFNLAFGAQAFLSAALFHDLTVEREWAVIPAFLISVFVVGTFVGLALDRFLFRHMRTAPWEVRLVSSLGLFVALPEIVKLWVGTKPLPHPTEVSINPEFVWRFGRFNIPSEHLDAIIATLAVVAVLSVMFKFTNIGLQMRAVVESPRMLELAGVDADRVSATAWVLSSVLAGLAGVLLAPIFHNVDSNNYMILIVAAIAASAFGRLSSIPLTLAGGLILGTGTVISGRYLPSGKDFWGLPEGFWTTLSHGVRPSLPFLMLFLLLLFGPGMRSGRQISDPLAGVDPPPPNAANSYKDAALGTVTKWLFGGFLIVVMGSALTWLPGLWVNRMTDAMVWTVIFLSITVFTGMSGQISLCQATFVAAGAFATGQLATNHGWPLLAAMLAGALVATAAGVLIAIPALRLGGIFLTLGTLAIALMAENVVFGNDAVTGGANGIDVARPSILGIDFQGDRPFFILTMAIFAICASAVILVRKGTTGQYLAALRGSETAAASIGINAVRARITIFALSASIAGVGGGLRAAFEGSVKPGTYPSLYGLFWVVLVVTVGARFVDGAANAGISFVFIPILLTRLFDLSLFSSKVFDAPLSWALIGFGFGAITYAKHPEGIVESQKRVVIESVVRRRQAKASAKEARTAAAGSRQ